MNEDEKLIKGDQSQKSHWKLLGLQHQRGISSPSHN